MQDPLGLGTIEQRLWNRDYKVETRDKKLEARKQRQEIEYYRLWIKD